MQPDSTRNTRKYVEDNNWKFCTHDVLSKNEQIVVNDYFNSCEWENYEANSNVPRSTIYQLPGTPKRAKAKRALRGIKTDTLNHMNLKFMITFWVHLSTDFIFGLEK